MIDEVKILKCCGQYPVVEPKQKGSCEYLCVKCASCGLETPDFVLPMRLSSISNVLIPSWNGLVASREAES